MGKKSSRPTKTKTRPVSGTTILLFFAILFVIIGLGLVMSWLLSGRTFDWQQYVSSVVQNLISTAIILVVLVAIVGNSSMGAAT